MKKIQFFTVLMILLSLSNFANAQWDYQVSNTPIVGLVEMNPETYTVTMEVADDKYAWVSNYYVSQFGVSFETFRLYDAEESYFCINSNGLISNWNTVNATNHGYEIPNSDMGYLIQYGGNSNGQLIGDMKAQTWISDDGYHVMTFDFKYQIGLNATDYSADIQISFIENLGTFEIHYTNVTGSTGTSDYCGVNKGNGTDYTLIDDGIGSFPTSDVSFLFTPGYENDLSVMSLSHSLNAESCEQNVNITATLLSTGINMQTDFDVVALLNGTEIDRITVSEELNQFDEVEIRFENLIFYEGRNTYSITIDLEDIDIKNNYSTVSFLDFISVQAEGQTIENGETATLTATSNMVDYFYWVSADAPTVILHEGTDAFVTPALTEDTEYWVFEDNSFYMPAEVGVETYIDHYAYSEDDRGGIAITPDYLYIVGDGNTARMDAEDLANPISLPIRDGLFSDLNDGTLYSFYNTDLGEMIDYDESYTYTITALIELDTDLEPTANIINLDTPIPTYSDGNSECAVFVGFGVVYVVDGDDGSLHKIEIATGITEYLGLHPEIEGDWATENWAMWGFVETIGTKVSLIFPYGDNMLKAFDIETSTISTVTELPRLSDFHSTILSPWHNRLYYHSETDEEDGGYFELLEKEICYTSVLVSVNPASINELNNNFEIYPNPSTGIYSLEFSEELKDAEIQITDISGKTIYQNTISSTIDISENASGIYFIAIKSNDKVFNTKLIIQK